MQKIRSRHLRLHGRLWLAALLLGAAGPALATNVPNGTVYGTDTTWDLAGSPYIVEGSVEVQGAAGPVLTIEAGVEVRFADFAYLRAGLSSPGGLAVQGTAGNEVLFTSNQAMPVRGQWYGIFLGSNALSSTIDHATVQWAGRNTSSTYGSIHLAGGTLALSQVSISEGLGAGVRVTGGTLTLTDSTLDGFTFASSSSPGSGVYANGTAATDITVSGCTIGNTDSTAVYLANDADITALIDGNPSLDGIYILGDLPDVTVTGNTFDDWGQVTSRMKPDVAARLTLDNTVNAVGGALAEVTAGTQTVDGSWSPVAGIHQVLGGVEVAGPADPTLTIEPNLEARFDDTAFLRAGQGNGGALMALGTPGNEILFTSSATTPARGQWYGVFFATNALPSTIEHTAIEWAGRNSASTYGSIHQAGGMLTLNQVSISEGNGAGVRVTGGTLTLTDSTLDGFTFVNTVSPGSGVYANGTAATDITVSGCTIGNTDSTAIYLANDADITALIDGNPSLDGIYILGDLPAVTVTGNTFNSWGQVTSRMKPDVAARITLDNTVNAVGGAFAEVTAGTQTVDGSWSPLAGIHRVLGVVDVAGPAGPTLTVAPNLEARFDDFALLRIGQGDSGALMALGTPGNEILFTSSATTPARGQWYGVFFGPNALPSTIEGTAIEWAGRNNASTYGSIHQAAGMLTLNQVSITEGVGAGVRVSGGTLTLTDSTLGGFSFASGTSPGSGVYAGTTTASDITVSGCTIGNTASTAIYLANDADITALIDNNPSLDGIYMLGDLPDVTVTGNTFDDWGQVTSRMKPDVAARITLDNTVNAVGGAFAEVTAGTQTVDGSWSPVAGIHRVLGVVDVADPAGPTLTVEPNLEARFDDLALLRIGQGDGGALMALGTPGNEILFTSSAATPARGQWYGVLFGPNALPSTIEGTAIQWAGRNNASTYGSIHLAAGMLTLNQVSITEGTGAGVRVTGGTLTLTDSVLDGFSFASASSPGSGVYANGTAATDITVSGCTIDNTASTAIYLANDADIVGTVDGNPSLDGFHYDGILPDVQFTNNTFDDFGLITSRAEPDAVGQITSANTFNPVGGAILEIIPGVVTVDSTWTDIDVPLVVLGNGDLQVQGADGADLATTLTLGPGVDLRMGSTRGLLVGGLSGDPGRLDVDGRLGGGGFDTVRLTSSNDLAVAGDWDGVVVLPTGAVDVHEAQIRYPAAGITVQGGGTLGTVNGLTVNRAQVGIDLLTGASSATAMNRVTFQSCDVGLRAAGVGAEIHNSNLVATTWAVQNLTPASSCIDASSNWWDDPSGPSGPAHTAGCGDDPAGSGSPVSDGVSFTPWEGQPPDDNDPIPSDQDNCPFVNNPSQEDQDGDGQGDACDSNPVFRVSTDPLDNPDFDNVQDAVDACIESGTTILVFPGLNPPYVASNRIDRDLLLYFHGAQGATESAGPVVIDGGSGPAFRLVNTDPLAVRPTEFFGLTLRGDQGINAATSVDVRDVVFESIVNEALDLTGGTSEISRSRVEPGAAIGVSVSAGAGATLSRVLMDQLTDAGVVADGAVTLENVLIGGGNGADGVRVGASGSLTARYTTIADNTGAGIDNGLGGTVAVDRSIVHGNAADDLLAVACTALSWSSTGVPDCSAVNDNVVADPDLESDYRLGPASSCLDHGPDPASYTGDPPTDADGGPRLRDYDGDGLAQNDCGAFERENTALSPGEVQNVRFELGFRIVWDAEPAAVEYHVYRDLLSNLSLASFGVCRDDLDAGRTDTMLDDMENPGAGQVFLYLISAEDGFGEEGTLGLGTWAERSNFAACP